MESCTCGGYAVAICSQCQRPLCNQHAYKRYAYPSTDEYKRLETFLSNFPNPVVRGKKFDFAGLVSKHLINSYEDRHVCLSCHQQNVQREASALLKGLTIPEDEVDFIMWLLFDTPFRKLVSEPYPRYTPYLSDEEVIQLWLRFARRTNVPLATSSPVWQVGPFTIDTGGKVYNLHYGTAAIIITPKHRTSNLEGWITNTVNSLLAAMPDSAFPMKDKEDDSAIIVYTDELLRQWQQQDAARQQHYQTLTATLQKTAMSIAGEMDRGGTRPDAAVGGFFSKTKGWFVSIDSRQASDEGGYAGSSYILADALIISKQGVLYTATGSTERLLTDPRTIINRSKKLSEVEVTSEEQFEDVRQKLADFAAQHGLSV